MTVEELIEKLKAFDGKLQVGYYDEQFGEVGVTGLEKERISRFRIYQKDGPIEVMRNVDVVVLE